MLVFVLRKIFVMVLVRCFFVVLKDSSRVSSLLVFAITMVCGVLGCGLMGSGIAQVSATAGFDVTVPEVEQKYLDKGFAGIEKSLAKLAEKGTLKESPEAVRGRLKGSTKQEELADCDIVIEAVIENLQEKKKMYGTLDAIIKKDAIFASNTSSISITELMTATRRPERFIGLHFF